MSRPQIIEVESLEDVLVALMLLGAFDGQTATPKDEPEVAAGILRGYTQMAAESPFRSAPPPISRLPDIYPTKPLATAPAAGVLPSDAKARKDIPLARALFDYFPDALAMVAQVSAQGNKQHNGDAPPFWAYDKSTDEADCLMRHFADRGTEDSDGLLHSAKVAWRALAMLQRELVLAGKAGLPRGARLTSFAPIKDEPADVTKVRAMADAAVKEAIQADMARAAKRQAETQKNEAVARAGPRASVSRAPYPYLDAKGQPLYPDSVARVVATPAALREVGINRYVADTLVTVVQSNGPTEITRGPTAIVEDKRGMGWTIPRAWLVKE